MDDHEGQYISNRHRTGDHEVNTFHTNTGRATTRSIHFTQTPDGRPQGSQPHILSPLAPTILRLRRLAKSVQRRACWLPASRQNGTSRSEHWDWIATYARSFPFVPQGFGSPAQHDIAWAHCAQDD